LVDAVWIGAFVVVLANCSVVEEAMKAQSVVLGPREEGGSGSE